MKPQAVESKETRGLNFRKSLTLLPYSMFVRGKDSGKSLCICAGSPEPLHADAISAKISHEHAHIILQFVPYQPSHSEQISFQK